MHRLPCDRYSLAKQCAPGFGNLLNLRHIVSQGSNKIYRSSATKAQKEMWKSMGMTAEGVALGMQENATETLKSVFT